MIYQYRLRIWIRFLIIWLPLAVIGLIVLLYNHNHDQNLRIQSIQETSIGQLKSAINAFGFRLAWVTRDLEYLRQLPALYQNGEAKETEFNKTIERQTKLFSDGRRGIYDHLRFIDKQGQERIRVQSINGQMTLLGDQLLQNKSDRGYVIETKRLAPGQIYISPFDLNIEHGQIELPIKPMIRFATPIYTTENEYNGAVVINYLGTDLLNRAERTFKKNYPNTWMVNANGGWIKSPDGLYDWNFMYEDRQNQNLRKTYPDVWKAINSGNSKPYQPIILSNGDLFTYATFTPQVLNNTPSQAGAEANTNKLFLISYFTAQELATATDIVSTEALFIFLLFLLISGVILYLNAHIWNKRIIAEESAKEGQEFYSTLLGATPDCILLVDSKGLIVESNQQIKDMFGYTGEAVIGHPVELLIPERFHKEHVSNRFRYMADPKRRIMGTGDTLWAKRNDSSEFPVSISLNKVETIRGTMFIAEIRDETEQYEKSQKLIEQNIELDARVKERTQALEKAIEISEQANVAKSDFLSNMSHEIRTPMNAILGLCYLLKKEDLSPAVDGMVHKIHIAGKSLLGIINDILDFSKIEANKLDIENIPFRLSDVLENLASIMASSLGSKNIETIIDAPPPGTDFLTGDGLRLGQVLINLAGNAIKFTEHGEVIVKIDKVQEDKAQKTVHLRFSVIDTGIGIEKEKLNNIFNAFSQADTSTSRTYGGTGLGLSISKQLVELMGGELEVYSVVGEGSKFTFELSFTLSEAIETAIPEMQFQRVLIADDQPTARSVLQRTMQSLGWSADIVENGKEAVELYAKNHAAKPYDVVLLDWRMPKMDGYDAIAEIKQMALPAPPLMIMITAHDKQKLLQTDRKGHVDIIATKPITCSVIYNAVLEAKNQQGLITNPVKNSNTVAGRLNGLKILVVDDSEINRDVAERILTEEGALIELAVDGQEALATLNIKKDFDIVLMDVQMPIMDGYIATSKIRNSPEFSDIPVIALTAGAMKVQRDKALEAGMNAYISKPFDVDELVEMINRLTARNATGSEERASEKNLGSAPQDSASNTNTEYEETPNPDFTKGLAIWIDENVFKKYLAKFRDNYSQTLDELPVLAEDQIKPLIHKLKGTSGSMGLTQLSRACADTEQLILEEKITDTAIQKVLSELQTALQAIDQYIQPITHQQQDREISHDPEETEKLIEQLIIALDEDDLDEAENHLKPLRNYLGEKKTQAITQALENFEIARAKREAQSLRISLNPSMDIHNVQ